MVGLSVFRTRMAGVVLAGTCFAALHLVASTSASELADLLTSAWYRHPDRVAYNIVLVVVAGGAAGATVVLRALQGTGRRVLEVGAVSALVVGVGAAALGPVRRHATELVPLTTTVTADEVAAFEFLGDHAGSADRVLNDRFEEGSAWMYTFESVMPVFQLQPVDWALWDERSWLAQNIERVGLDPRVDALVDAYAVRYVYYGERTFFGGADRLMDLAELRTAPGLRLAFERGAVHVFEVERAH